MEHFYLEDRWCYDLYHVVKIGGLRIGGYSDVFSIKPRKVTTWFVR